MLDSVVINITQNVSVLPYVHKLNTTLLVNTAERYDQVHTALVDAFGRFVAVHHFFISLSNSACLLKIDTCSVRKSTAETQKCFGAFAGSTNL